jgi:hypothetical protein
MRARRLGLFAVILVAALLTLSPTPGRPDDRPTFTLAVLRRDGAMIPFATFDGKRWTNRWPAQNAMEVPIALADVPKDWWPGNQARIEWTAWLTSGATVPIKVQAPVLLDVHCTRRVGLRTDFVAMEPPPPPDFQPYPKSGLAVTGSAPVSIEKVELLPPNGPEAKALIEKIRDELDDTETTSVRAWARSWTHPVDDKGRAKTPFTLEVFARTPGLTVNSTASYFEGVKKYPGFIQVPQGATASGGINSLPQMCEYLTFGGGWLLTGGTKEGLVVGADLSNCNREGLVYTLPLGAIRTAGRLFWIVQASSWDFERYDVVEIKQTDTKSALSVGGGTCR